MNQPKIPAPVRPLPALERDSAFYWTSGAKGELQIARCDACAHYIHPPQPYCSKCGGTGVSPVAVSGKGRIATFTVNEQTWLPGLEVPYIIAAIELIEQPQLYVFANIVGCPTQDVHSGMTVSVEFEQHGKVFLPMFRPTGGGNG